MEKIHEIDGRIKMALLCKTNEILPSEETFTQILAGLEKSQARRIFNISHKRYIIAFMCATFMIFGTTLMLSVDARASAMEIINTVKSVFILDNNNKVVEKPAAEAFIKPAVSLTTHLSDAELSEKMGVKVSFPRTLYGEFNLQERAEAIGFTKSLDYETFGKLESDAVQAINNKEILKNLEKYQPWRSVGGIYKNAKGVMVYTAIFNKELTIPTENINITETIPTKIGEINAKWVSLSQPDYPGNDMTQKPVGEESAHLLIWSTNNTTYEILLKSDNTLSMAETVKIAESFLIAQK